MTIGSSITLAVQKILHGNNNALNSIFGVSTGELDSPYITSSFDIIGGDDSLNTLVGDAYTLSGNGYEAGYGYAAGLVGGNTIVGGANASNFMTGSAYQVINTGPPPLGYSGTGPVPNEMEIGHNTIVGGADSNNNGYGDAYIINTVLAAGGSNTLTGGANSTNNMAGDAYSIVGQGVTVGANTLTGGADSNNFLFGDAWIMNGSGAHGASGGGNHVTGDNYSLNMLYGGAQQLSATASTGHNTVTGGASSTNYEFGDGQEMDDASGGDNTVIGGADSTNYLYGDALVANAATPSGTGLSQGGGNTVEAGLNSTSYMWGGAALGTNYEFNPLTRAPLGIQDFAANTFVFTNGDGTAYIEDFREAIDLIDLKGFSGLSSFSQLDITVSGGDSTINVGSNRIVVSNDTQLTAADFKFG